MILFRLCVVVANNSSIPLDEHSMRCEREETA